MDRRSFITGLGALAAGMALAPARASALLYCAPFDANGIQQCQAGIDSSFLDVAAGAVNGQHMNQWCWAACIEMVFRYYGLVVPQERIVRETWGDVYNMPAEGPVILQNLNRQWVDDTGKYFWCQGDSYSANYVTAAQDLANDMPLIIGTQGHAVVLTALSYYRNNWGQGEVLQAVVRDPWPGRGRRELSIEEWYGIFFMARIRVTT